MQLARVRAASKGWIGGPGLNTFYFSAGPDANSDIITDSHASASATRVRNAFLSATGAYPPAWKVNVSTTVDVIESSNGALVNSFTATPQAEVSGSSGATFGPTAVMLLLRLSTDVFSDGRKIQGRAFMGPIGAIVDPDGSPQASTLAVMATFATSLMDAGVSQVPVLRVWRRPREARVGGTIDGKVIKPLAQRAGSAARVVAITSPDKFAILRSRRD